MISRLLLDIYKEQSKKMFIEVTVKEITDMNTRFNAFTPKAIKYTGMQFRTKTLYWKTGKYEQKVRIPDLAVISRLKGDDEEKVWMALNQGDVLVNCTCPDFTFGGFKYIATELGFSIEKETRFPKINNPNVDGSVCKHLDYLLNNINDFNSEIVSDLKDIRKQGKNYTRIYH